MTISRYTRLTYRICAGRRFSVASSLTRHVRKCMQKAHPRMDVGTMKKIAVSQSVFSTPAPAAQDPPYDAARGLESGAASPVCRLNSIHHLSTYFFYVSLMNLMWKKCGASLE